MNAVERLWRALQAREWKRAEAQMHPHAVIEMPATGRRFATRQEYLMHHIASPEERAIHVDLVVHEGKQVAVKVTITTGGEVEHGACLYELQEGGSARRSEIWTRRAAGPRPARRRARPRRRRRRRGSRR